MVLGGLQGYQRQRTTQLKFLQTVSIHPHLHYKPNIINTNFLPYGEMLREGLAVGQADCQNHTDYLYLGTQGSK